MSAEVQFIVFDSENCNQRIDNYLIKILKGVPKSHIYRLLRSGQVRVNKKRVSAEYRLADGDVLRVPPVRVSQGSEKAIIDFSQKSLIFPVLYEDEALLLINKPSGVAVHGGSGVSYGVIEALRKQYPQYPNLELAHRLDRDTSGVLILCKKRAALRVMHLQFRPDFYQKKEIEKLYHCLVFGKVTQENVNLQWNLTKTINSKGERVVKVDHMGKAAKTQVKLLASNQTVSLLEVRLLSGRTHQIRVHLAHWGFPIVGDERYGDFALNHLASKNGLKQMMLHAKSIQFTHPLKDEKLLIEAAYSTEFSDYLRYCNLL